MTSLREVEWQISYGPSDDRLNRFYIPALQRSVQYDRSTGFFSSSALAVAAAGVAGLIANGGRMRLLVGAQLSREDVEAVTRGAALEGIVAEKLIAALEEPVEDLLRRRLEILAWMIARGTLQIKVVLPRDAHGLPVPADQAQDYYHPKEGVFTDAAGNQVAFSGSINESMTGWQRNYEQFSVYFSWDSSQPYLRQVVHRFNNVWEGRERGWIAFDIPQAARQSLLRFVPANAPEHDPLAPPPVIAVPPPDLEAQLRRERLIFQFIRDIPYFPNAGQLGAATCTITPWPHQMRVAQQIIETYPRRYMLCDEVGLGKTIEAGLVLRQLVISGRVKRCLLLVPKSVARQWQEELYEKFVLDVPLFDGKRFWNYAGEALEYNTGNPWDAFDMMIASSQLAKRRTQQERVTSARPWDLVLVDEAHHARRRDFLQPIYRPNRLLELLTAPDFRANAILLMTATPMQVHPLEVWDLLKVLGLGGKWGADEGNFLRFYSELMKPFDEIDWDFVFEMLNDYREYSGQIDPEFEEEIDDALGVVDGARLQQLLNAPHPSREVRSLPENAKPYIVKMARRHTPLRALMFRNTRDLLREYVRCGLLKENVPTRDPQLVWIPMRPDEMALYQRIEEYISDFYRKYENERKGLGFVMTVYRRRLTSSFYAVQKSLERRLDYLRGRAVQVFDDDDLEQAYLEQDDTEEIVDENQRALYKDEIDYVETFIRDLQPLVPQDSKTDQLIQDLNDLFRKRETALVFTQYTDTMDYLRDKLRQVYGNQVACYSGRGGEVWNGIAWVSIAKEEIKQKFREGKEVKILVCTEAASEGLNLQSCGVLINYDMPWNPMRVEQRIGRIDRIGQVYSEVWIRNYFYEETVEARVYQALARRINWFKGVVGDLQPILARVGQAIERVVMTTPDERERVLAGELDEIERKLDQKGDILNVYESSESVRPGVGIAAPITLDELERCFLESSFFAHQFIPHPDIKEAYLINAAGEQAVVTFKPELFDRFPNSLQLLSYGNQTLDALLDQDSLPERDVYLGIARFSSDNIVPLKAYYGLNQDGQPVLLRTLQDLLGALKNTHEAGTWTQEARQRAEEDFEKYVQDARKKYTSVTDLRLSATAAALVEQAVRIVFQATLLDLLLDGNFSTAEDAWHAITTGNQLTQNLVRHGYPFTALLELASRQKHRASVPRLELDVFSNAGPDQLKRMFRDVRQEGETLLKRWKKMQKHG
ncbi:MAG: DEAD/DEAH box helicase family protein [Anaerolineae bacterium]|nr:DEAD/DEAH box helicase family protein [Anaerolineae bacterium]